MRFLPSRLLASLESGRDHRMVMAVADDVQLNLLVVSRKRSREVSVRVRRDFATFAFLVFSILTGLTHPLKMVHSATMVSVCKH